MNDDWVRSTLELPFCVTRDKAIEMRLMYLIQDSTRIVMEFRFQILKDDDVMGAIENMALVKMNLKGKQFCLVFFPLIG